MVDPLTAGTAVLGFMGFAGQILDGAKKFREFCRDVNDAPSGTSQVAEGLALLHGILEQVGARLRSLPSASLIQSEGAGDLAPVLKNALDQCGFLGQEASKVVNKRKRALETGNVLSRVKAAITKDDITSLLVNIERVKGSLSLLLKLLLFDLMISQIPKHEQAISSLTAEVHLLNARSQIPNTHFLYEVHARNDNAQFSAPNTTFHQSFVQDYEQSFDNRVTPRPNFTFCQCNHGATLDSATSQSTSSTSCRIDNQQSRSTSTYELPRPPNFGFYHPTTQEHGRIFDPDDPRLHEPNSPRKRLHTVRSMYSIRIPLPMGILPYICEINWESVGRGWKHTFSIQRVVSDDCPFFTAIWEGDTVTANRLLNNGEASLTDVNPDGRTIVEQMLEICMSDKHTKKTTYSRLARSAVFILHHPTCPKFEDIIANSRYARWSQFFYTWSLCRQDPSAQTDLSEVVRMCLTDATIPLEEVSQWLLEREVHDPTHAMAAFKRVIDPPWESLSTHARLNIFLSHPRRHDGSCDPETILRALGFDGYDHMWAACDDDMSGRLIRYMFAEITGSGDRWEERASLWKHFFATWPQKPHAVHAPISCFLHHLNTIQCDITEDHAVCRDGARSFARILDYFGFDLDEFGKAEEQVWAVADAKRDTSVHGLDGVWTRFEYGKRISDWFVHREICRRYDAIGAHDFTYPAESPPLRNVPGFWPDSILVDGDRDRGARFCYRPRNLGAWVDSGLP